MRDKKSPGRRILHNWNASSVFQGRASGGGNRGIMVCRPAIRKRHITDFSDRSRTEFEPCHPAGLKSGAGHGARRIDAACRFLRQTAAEVEMP